jgi:hypothetical protein
MLMTGGVPSSEQSGQVFFASSGAGGVETSEFVGAASLLQAADFTLGVPSSEQVGQAFIGLVIAFGTPTSELMGRLVYLPPIPYGESFMKQRAYGLTWLPERGPRLVPPPLPLVPIPPAPPSEPDGLSGMQPTAYGESEMYSASTEGAAAGLQSVPVADPLVVYGESEMLPGPKGTSEIP